MLTIRAVAVGSLLGHEEFVVHLLLCFDPHNMFLRKLDSLFLSHSAPPGSFVLPLAGCAIVLPYKQLFCKQSGEIVGYLRLRILNLG